MSFHIGKKFTSATCKTDFWIMSYVLASLSVPKATGQSSCHECLPAAFWHHPSSIQSLKKLNLLRLKPRATSEREGGNGARGDGEKKKKGGKKDREREGERDWRGGEQRNWEMREGLGKGQGEKKEEGGRVHVFC